MKLIQIMAASAAAAALAGGAHAQTLDDAEAEVWSFIDSAWQDHAQANTWYELVHEDGFGWGSSDYPMGRDRATMERYSEALGGEGEILFMELSPVNIALAGDTAIAHYYSSVVATDHAGERSTDVQQCADTLVRTDGEWLFLGWGCRTVSDD
ncbi:MAG: hypothetical protein RKE49_08620 [Oceanicaulis sp.]